MEFFQTRLGQKFYEKDLPSLIGELGELKQEIAELRKPKESMVIVLKDEWDLGKIIKEHTEVTCYPYEYNKDHDCWVNISRKVTLTAYRAGYKRGTKCMK